jgi:hypothetical protein
MHRYVVYVLQLCINASGIVETTKYELEAIGTIFRLTHGTKENRFWVGKRVGKDDSQERQDVENRSGSAGSGEKAHADHKGEIQAGVVVPANAGCLTRPH